MFRQVLVFALFLGAFGQKEFTLCDKKKCDDGLTCTKPSSKANVEVCLKECRNDGDCEVAQSCTNGFCYKFFNIETPKGSQECSHNDDCSSSHICLGMVCTLPASADALACNPQDARPVCKGSEICDAEQARCVTYTPAQRCAYGQIGGFCAGGYKCDTTTFTCQRDETNRNQPADKIPEVSVVPEVPSRKVGFSEAPRCVDRSVPGRASDCPQKKYLCNNRIYHKVMTEQCPYTCGRCPGQNGNGSGSNTYCQDALPGNGQASQCSELSYLCHYELYREVMRIQCPRTCGFC
ncbi:hypothetical protein L596_022624 [Steinernema carpocapsae]|uniref:ShKT domain-containing protein n=1 Tax=Steinernema carpocapsae TaxID=34508 RepID=A0A4U5MMC7_STECR|nr:hypothetical protein L596_022624 [Steinernema carpocapsae]